jgi:hypothetical protein
MNLETVNKYLLHVLAYLQYECWTAGHSEEQEAWAQETSVLQPTERPHHEVETIGS